MGVGKIGFGSREGGVSVGEVGAIPQSTSNV